jgi:hypothetical protein
MMTDDIEKLSSLDDELASDPRASLVALMRHSSAMVPPKGMRELAFMRVYCSEGEKLANSIEETRRAGADVFAVARDALKAVSLHELLNRIGLNLNR